MDAKLLIKYEWEDSQKGFDMSALGESFIGFHNIIEELFDLSRIEGKLEIRTIKVKEGSVELINVLHVVLTTMPFPSIQSLYDFLEVSDPNLLAHAQSYFVAAGNIAKTVDDYLNAHPFQSSVLSNLLAAYIIFLIGKHQGRKEADPNKNRNLPLRYGNRLDQLKGRNAYQKALKPLTDGGFSKIKVAQLGVAKPKKVVISEDKIDDYLSESLHILPDFVNGEEVELIASVVGLQSTRGETVKLKVYDIDPTNDLLMAHPPEGQGTEQYKELYGETVRVVAEVFRRSKSKRPELIIRSMESHQSKLIFTSGAL